MTEVQKVAAFIPISKELADICRVGPSINNLMQEGLRKAFRDMEQPPIRINWPEPIPEIGRWERRWEQMRGDIREWKRWKTCPREAWDVLRYGSPVDVDE